MNLVYNNLWLPGIKLTHVFIEEQNHTPRILEPNRTWVFLWLAPRHVLATGGSILSQSHRSLAVAAARRGRCHVAGRGGGGGGRGSESGEALGNDHARLTHYRKLFVSR